MAEKISTCHAEKSTGEVREGNGPGNLGPPNKLLEAGNCFSLAKLAYGGDVRQVLVQPLVDTVFQVK